MTLKLPALSCALAAGFPAVPAATAKDPMRTSTSFTFARSTLTVETR